MPRLTDGTLTGILTIATDDLMHIVDVSDPTHNPNGTSKYMTIAQLNSAMDHASLSNLTYDTAGHGSGFTGFQRGTTLSATSPTINFDSSIGYAIGDHVFNTALGFGFYCVDNSVGAAIWRQSDAMISTPTTGSTVIGATGAHTTMTGNQDTVIGENAAPSLASNQCVMIGTNAGLGLNSAAAHYNIFIGAFCGDLTSAVILNNTVIGRTAARAIQGSNNSIFGVGCAPYAVSNNTCFGSNIAINPTSNISNCVLLGQNAGKVLEGAANATTITGVSAGQALTVGIVNCIYGAFAANSLVSGGSNFIGGYSAGNKMTVGDNNVILGRGAAQETLGISNAVIIGYEAGRSCTADNSVLIGYQCGRSILGGTDNVGMGAYVLDACTTGGSNTSVGNESSSALTIASGVCTFGYKAGGLADVNELVAVGYKAGEQATQIRGVWIGSEAGQLNSGTTSTGVGYQVLKSASGNDSSALGYQAGLGVTSGYGDFIGYNSGSDVTTQTNVSLIGLNSVIGAYGNNTMILGNATQKVVVPGTVLNSVNGYQVNGTPLQSSDLADIGVGAPAAGKIFIYNNTAAEYQTAFINGTAGEINVSNGDASITLSLANPITDTVKSSVAEDVDFDNTEVLATGLGTNFGLLIVRESTGNVAALYAMQYQTLVAIVADPLFSTTKDTAAKYNVYWETDQFKVQNLVGDNKNIRVGFFGV